MQHHLVQSRFQRWCLLSEVYSHLHEELEMRLAEAERVGYGFDLPVNPTAAVVPIVPKNRKQKLVEVAA